jgi:hypothetical protein
LNSKNPNREIANHIDQEVDEPSFPSLTEIALTCVSSPLEYDLLRNLRVYYKYKFQ